MSHLEFLEQKLGRDIVKYCVLPMLEHGKKRIKKRFAKCMKAIRRNKMHRNFWGFRKIYDEIRSIDRGRDARIKNAFYQNVASKISGKANRTIVWNERLTRIEWHQSHMYRHIKGKTKQDKVFGSRMGSIAERIRVERECM